MVRTVRQLSVNSHSVRSMPRSTIRYYHLHALMTSEVSVDCQKLAVLIKVCYILFASYNHVREINSFVVKG